MRVVVTGAAGFIGSHVCARLAADPRVTSVAGIDDLSTGSLDNLAGLELDLTRGSILDAESLDRATAGADAIVHLAARPSVPRSIDDPVASHEANTVGTMRVLEAARRLDDAHVVVASSSSVYGSNPVLPKHEGLATLPLSPYAASKLATEQYALAWQHSYGLRALAFRFFNVFGPHQRPGHAYAAAIPAFAWAALHDEPAIVYGDGEQSRDFTYVGTLADVVVDAVVRGVSHPTPVNLAFGTNTTLLEVLAELEAILGRPVARDHVPARVGDVRHSQADNALLRSLFPDVQPVGLRDGLTATVAWLRSVMDPTPTP